jgi:hypothetical protein
MDNETYLHLFHLVAPHIRKNDNAMRRAFTPHERLSVTLRFLATGRSYEDLKFSAAISAQSLGVIIPETCAAIHKVPKKKYLKVKFIYICNLYKVIQIVGCSANEKKYKLCFIHFLNIKTI